jgi:hypothetical protein
LSVRPRVYAGEQLLLDLPRPAGAFGDAVGYFRAHGRLFWAVAYMLLAASLAVLDRRLPGRAVLALCAAAVLLQALDTRELRRAVAGTFAGPAAMLFPPALRDAPGAAGRHWRFLPTLYCATDDADRQVIRQMSLLAVRRGGSSNSAPTARNPIADCKEPVRAALRGEAADDVLVLLRQSLRADGLVAELAGRRPCHGFGRGLICGTGLDGVPGLPRADPGGFAPRLADWGEAVPLAGPRARDDLFGHGWSEPEPTHRWSDGPDAALVFLPPPLPLGGAPLSLRLEAVGYEGRAPGGAQRVAASVNGGPSVEWRVDSRAWGAYDLPLPAEASAGREAVVVRFALPDAVAPAEMGRGPGARRLGIAVRQLGFGRPEARPD